jgi:hypothetical protein
MVRIHPTPEYSPNQIVIQNICNSLLKKEKNLRRALQIFSAVWPYPAASLLDFFCPAAARRSL